MKWSPEILRILLNDGGSLVHPVKIGPNREAPHLPPWGTRN